MVGPRNVTSYDGVPASELERRLGAPRCLVYERVTSTLDIVHECAEQGAVEGTLVLAEEQVSGRGRHGRRWHSAPGAGIWLGLLRRPARLTESGLIALRVGLAVGEALDSLQVESRIKWPNDIVVCDRKLGGILCETRSGDAGGEWIAIGIGINIQGRLPHELADRAICLESVLPNPSRLDLLDRLVPLLLQLSDAPSLTEPELRAFRARDWLRGRQVVAPVAGTVVGIAADGTLLVESFGEVTRIRGGTVVPA